MFRMMILPFFGVKPTIFPGVSHGFHHASTKACSDAGCAALQRPPWRPCCGSANARHARHARRRRRRWENPWETMGKPMGNFSGKPWEDWDDWWWLAGWGRMEKSGDFWMELMELMELMDGRFMGYSCFFSGIHDISKWDMNGIVGDWFGLMEMI